MFANEIFESIDIFLSCGAEAFILGFQQTYFSPSETDKLLRMPHHTNITEETGSTSFFRFVYRNHLGILSISQIPSELQSARSVGGNFD